MSAFNAKAIARHINRNVAALDAGRISFEEFSALQRAAWDAVARGEQNIIGSACSRRHLAVVKALGIVAA